MFQVDKNKCKGCSVCMSFCPVQALSLVNGKAEINTAKCMSCGRCKEACPEGAIYSYSAQPQEESLTEAELDSNATQFVKLQSKTPYLFRKGVNFRRRGRLRH